SRASRSPGRPATRWCAGCRRPRGNVGDVEAGAEVTAGAVAARPQAPGPRPWPAGAIGTEISDAALRQVLLGLPGVDQVAAAQRTAGLATRSIKRDAKLWALEAAIRMVDLTTLEGADTPGKVRDLCAKARQPDPADPAVPPVA